MLEYQNTKPFLLKDTPNWSEEVFVIKETKTTLHGFILLVVSMVKKLLGYFMKNNLKKQGAFYEK